MNKEVADKWIVLAKESTYGKGWLNKGGCMCILGVLCELYRREMGGEWDENGRFRVDGDETGSDNYPPNSVLDWAGVSATDPLWSYNDNEEAYPLHLIKEMAQ